VQASRPGSRTDRAISAASLFFYSLPDFWLALVVLYLFTVKIPAFPSGVNINSPALSWSARSWDTALHMVLPVATLALLTVALVARFQRSAVLEVSHNDYVRTARAKGAGERRVLLRHVLRNAMLPLITLLGLALPALFGGAVFIERIFSWPGMGNLTVGAIASRDYQLVSAIVLVAAVLVSLGNLLADMLYAAVDPRIRTAR
jgi:peptide/nickel transport system permease protein